MKRSLPPPRSFPAFPRSQALGGPSALSCGGGSPPAWACSTHPLLPSGDPSPPPSSPYPRQDPSVPSLCLFQTHQPQLSLSPVTSLPLVSPPELGQPSWVLQDCHGLLQAWCSSRGTIPRCSRACPWGSRGRGTPAHGQGWKPVTKSG